MATLFAPNTSRERYRRVALTGLSLGAAKLISIGSVLITVPITLDHLGAERFGLWMTITAMMSILSFADFGVGNGLINAISAAHGHDDRDDARKAVSSSFFLLCGFSALFLVILTSVYPFFDLSGFFTFSTATVQQEAELAVLVLFICLALNIPLSTIQKVQMGYQEGYKNSLWQIAGSLLGLGGILATVYFQGSLPLLVLASLGAPVVATMLNWLHGFYRARPWLRPTLARFEWRVGKAILSAGLVFAFLQLIAFLGPASDNLVIAWIFGPARVADYAVVSKLFSAVFIVQFFTIPLWPAFAEAVSANHWAWARQAFIRVIAVSLAASVLLGLGFFAFAQSIITIWVGDDFVPSIELVAGFSAWIIVLSLYSTISSVLSSGPFLKYMPPIFGTAAVLAIVLKFVFASLWGLSGIIFASVVAYGLLCGPALFTVKRLLWQNGPEKAHCQS